MQLSLLVGIVLIGALCFVLGASSGLLKVAGAPAQSVAAAEQVLLPVLGQRACQVLCVEADRQKLRLRTWTRARGRRGSGLRRESPPRCSSGGGAARG